MAGAFRVKFSLANPIALIRPATLVGSYLSPLQVRCVANAFATDYAHPPVLAELKHRVFTPASSSVSGAVDSIPFPIVMWPHIAVTANVISSGIRAAMRSALKGPGSI